MRTLVQNEVNQVNGGMTKDALTSLLLTFGVLTFTTGLVGFSALGCYIYDLKIKAALAKNNQPSEISL